MKKLVTIELDFVHNPDQEQVEDVLQKFFNAGDMISLFRENGLIGIQYLVDDIDEQAAAFARGI